MGSLHWSRFEGGRLVERGWLEDGSVLTEELEGEPREDQTQRLGGSLRFAGALMLSLEYAWILRESNSFRGGYERHSLLLSGTGAFWGLLFSTQLGLQRVAYEDRQYLSADTYLEDEKRSHLRLRLERPLLGSCSLVAHLGAWGSLFGGGPDYQRRVFLLGLAHHQD